jgi:hypothetical protein
MIQLVTLDDAEIKSAFNYSSGYDTGKEIITKLFSPTLIMYLIFIL